ncbi:unnamed protein product [Urochloa humidicola]
MDDEADDITDAYDRLIHEGTQVERTSIQNYLSQQLGRLANEAGVAMAHTSEGNAGGYLHAFAERVRRSCRRMYRSSTASRLQMQSLLLVSRARSLLG